jgi:hypothetical protein
MDTALREDQVGSVLGRDHVHKDRGRVVRWVVEGSLEVVRRLTGGHDAGLLGVCVGRDQESAVLRVAQHRPAEPATEQFGVGDQVPQAIRVTIQSSDVPELRRLRCPFCIRCLRHASPVPIIAGSSRGPWANNVAADG